MPLAEYSFMSAPHRLWHPSPQYGLLLATKITRISRDQMITQDKSQALIKICSQAGLSKPKASYLEGESESDSVFPCRSFQVSSCQGSSLIYHATPEDARGIGTLTNLNSGAPFWKRVILSLPPYNNLMYPVCKISFYF